MKNGYQGGFLNSNVLKIIALVAMTIDHIGMIFFPQAIVLRIIGRIAFPIYAFFIAEGCKYTKNKLKYFLNIFILGCIWQLIVILLNQDYTLNILITFSFSIGTIYLIDWFKVSVKNSYKKQSIISFICIILLITATFLLNKYGNLIITGFAFTYGFFGVMLAVLISLSNNKIIKTLLFIIGLIHVCIFDNIIQWFSLLSVMLVWFYNGERGKYKLKWLFYLYYPAHLLILWFIYYFIA